MFWEIVKNDVLCRSLGGVVDRWGDEVKKKGRPELQAFPLLS